MTFLSPGAQEWGSLEVGNILYEKATIKTAEQSTCTLLFKGMTDSVVEMRPNSVMELFSVSSTPDRDKTELTLSLGAVLVDADHLRGASEFEIRTPNSVVGISGTVFEVNVTDFCLLRNFFHSSLAIPFSSPK